MKVLENQVGLRERYLRDDEAIRFGNLASSLARAARGASIPARQETVAKVLREASDFATWSAEANAAGAPLLLNMRGDLKALLSNWENRPTWDEALAQEVAAKCRDYSEKALALSGLLEK
jgi:hypothetical protein